MGSQLINLTLPGCGPDGKYKELTGELGHKMYPGGCASSLRPVEEARHGPCPRLPWCPGSHEILGWTELWCCHCGGSPAALIFFVPLWSASGTCPEPELKVDGRESGFKSLRRALGRDLEMLAGSTRRSNPVESLPLVSQEGHGGSHPRCMVSSPLAWAIAGAFLALDSEPQLFWSFLHSGRD